MPKRKYTDEQLFQMYLGLGEERTLQQLADNSGYSLSRLQKLSAIGKWKERLRNTCEEDKNLIKAFVSDNANITAILESEVYKGVSERLLQTLRDSMELLEPSGNPRDIKTLLDTYRLLNNQPTDITRQETATVTEEKAQSLTDDELFSIPEDVLDRLMN